MLPARASFFFFFFVLNFCVEVDLTVDNPITWLLQTVFVIHSQTCQLAGRWYDLMHLPSSFIFSSRQGMFFIYFRVISHKFVSAPLRKPCCFSHDFWRDSHLILFQLVLLANFKIYFVFNFPLRIIAGKTHPQIILKLSRKVLIWIFRQSVH